MSHAAAPEALLGGEAQVAVERFHGAARARLRREPIFPPRLTTEPEQSERAREPLEIGRDRCGVFLEGFVGNTGDSIEREDDFAAFVVF